MTDKQPRRIINEEQVEAAQAAARAANPNRDRIEALRAKSMEIHREILALMTDEERYTNLLLALLSRADSHKLAASFMSGQELSEHLYNLFAAHAINDLDNAILDEAMERLGYKIEDLGEEELK